MLGRGALVLLLVLTLTAGSIEAALTPEGTLQADTRPGPDADKMGRWIWSPGGHAPPDALPGVTRLLAQHGIVFHVLPNLGMVTMLATPSQVEGLGLPGRIDASQQLPLHLDRSVKAIEADVVKAAVGPVGGNGPTILVVDTGIDSTHPDFQDTLVANVRPELRGGLIIGSLDQAPVLDAAGHGTHVGGIVAGTGNGFGAAGGVSGKYAGVYGNGRVASYQVTLETGTEEPQVDTTAALEAFDWAMENRLTYNILVVSNSWGASGDFDAGHPVNQATLQMYKAGMTVVFSAGNEGRDGPDTLNKYCLAPWVVCVAAATLDGARASFSSYGGPGAPYNHPDLSAPGHQITSAKPIANLAGGFRSGSIGENLYIQRSGTSMAAPHVAGAAGLILAANAALSPDQVMDILVATTDPMADDLDRVGSGFLNVRQAFNLAVQTPGDREDFLKRDLWKYAGADSGDPRHARDAVSVGYDGVVPEGEILDAREMALWITTPLAWLILATALLAVAVGIRWRSPRPAKGALGGRRSRVASTDPPGPASKRIVRASPSRQAQGPRQ